MIKCINIHSDYGTITLAQCLQFINSSFTEDYLCNLTKPKVKYDLIEVNLTLYFWVSVSLMGCLLIVDLFEICGFNTDECCKSITYYICWYVL